MKETCAPGMAESPFFTMSLSAVLQRESAVTPEVIGDFEASVVEKSTGGGTALLMRFLGGNVIV